MLKMTWRDHVANALIYRTPSWIGLRVARHYWITKAGRTRD